MKTSLKMNPSVEYVFSWGEEDKKFAEKELNETDETRREALIEIKKWLSEEKPNLNAPTSDRDILPFLRGSKFNISKTKEKITNFYTMRRDRPEFYSDRNPLLNEIQELTRLGVFLPLRQTHDKKLVVIIRTAGHDPKRHSQNDVFKTGMMILDMALKENELVQIYGVLAVFDMQGLAFGHAAQLTPSVIKNAVYAWQNYFCRPKQLEFVRAPSYVNVILSIFKRFMSEKMRNRVRVHFGGVNDLHGIIDKKILPSEYGGEGESCESLANYWHGKLLENRDWFATDEKNKAD